MTAAEALSVATEIGFARRKSRGHEIRVTHDAARRTIEEPDEQQDKP